LQKNLDKNTNILDIDIGNGEHLDLALSNIDLEKSSNVKLNLVEPNADLATQLEDRFVKRFPLSNFKVINTSLQDFKSNDIFDVVLMSHLFYHLPRISWTTELSKALSLLKENGLLIIVLREKDDAYNFKMAFKLLLFDASFKALTIDDVLETLPKKPILRIDKQLHPLSCMYLLIRVLKIRCRLSNSILIKNGEIFRHIFKNHLWSSLEKRTVYLSNWMGLLL
jgi:SAM-dependent methyltransferase